MQRISASSIAIINNWMEGLQISLKTNKIQNFYPFIDVTNLNNRIWTSLQK